MAKPINTSKDGVIFINFLKPVVKWIRYAPPQVKIAVGAGAIAVGVIVYGAIKVRQACSTAD